ncbi:MAG: phosphoribosylamine--glycine ligase [bacterium]|nr:phosphoribosylamine--glycine ligase [bacterium]
MDEGKHRVLVVGGGGREHALIWAISHSPLVARVYCAPGNAGISHLADCREIAADNIHGLLELAVTERIDLTVVGPEGPLAAGIADTFRRNGLLIFGPSLRAAMLEVSKGFCKGFLTSHRIPTAAYRRYSHSRPAKAFVRKHGAPIVVKADGLCGGKGVTVAMTVNEAEAAIDQILVDRVFGPAGNSLILEDCLTGRECSFTVITDGTHVVPLCPARDFKRLRDGDQGPNTGGMGAYSPLPDVTPALEHQIMERIVKPTVRALERDQRAFVGALYFGLMLTDAGPKVLEINCRLGDPETQVTLPRLESDVVELLLGAATGTLYNYYPRWRPQSAVGIVLAAPGYGTTPTPRTGLPISGLRPDGTLAQGLVFHAATRRGPDGGFITAGGRVLSVVALGGSIDDARQAAYRLADGVVFRDRQFRTDIAAAP